MNIKPRHREFTTADGTALSEIVIKVYKASIARKSWTPQEGDSFLLKRATRELVTGGVPKNGVDWVLKALQVLTKKLSSLSPILNCNTIKIGAFVIVPAKDTGLGGVCIHIRPNYVIKPLLTLSGVGILHPGVGLDATYVETVRTSQSIKCEKMALEVVPADDRLTVERLADHHQRLASLSDDASWLMIGRAGSNPTTYQGLNSMLLVGGLVGLNSVRIEYREGLADIISTSNYGANIHSFRDTVV